MFLKLEQKRKHASLDLKTNLRTFRFLWLTISGSSRSDRLLESSDNCSSLKDSFFRSPFIILLSEFGSRFYIWITISTSISDDNTPNRIPLDRRSTYIFTRTEILRPYAREITASLLIFSQYVGLLHRLIDLKQIANNLKGSLHTLTWTQSKLRVPQSVFYCTLHNIKPCVSSNYLLITARPPYEPKKQKPQIYYSAHVTSMEIKIYQATTNELDQRGSSVLITHNNKPSLVFKTKLRKNDTKKKHTSVSRLVQWLLTVPEGRTALYVL